MSSLLVNIFGEGSGVVDGTVVAILLDEHDAADSGDSIVLSGPLLLLLLLLLLAPPPNAAVGDDGDGEA